MSDLRVRRLGRLQALVHQRNDLIQRVGLESLLAGDPTDQAVDPLDVIGAAQKRETEFAGVARLGQTIADYFFMQPSGNSKSAVPGSRNP